MAKEGVTRRRVLQGGSTSFMVAGLASGYGTLAYIGLRFLYPQDRQDQAWQVVGTVEGWRAGEARTYVAPNGAPVVIARRGSTGQASDFIAFSSVCPHLGCRVHWEEHNDRFLLPLPQWSF